MAFRRYRIEGPVTDGAIVLEDILQPGLERGYISVLFYSEATFENVVTPSAGTITFEVSETGDRYGTIMNGTVQADSPTYDRPNFSGSVDKLRATCNSIAGATHYRAVLSMFGNG